MKKIILLAVLLYGAELMAQTSEQKQFFLGKNRIAGTEARDSSLTPAQRKELQKFYLPSIIASSGIAPASFKNFSIALGSSKASLELGTTSKNVRWSYGGKITAEAPNDSRTLFKPGVDKTPFDFTSDIKITRNNAGTKWFATGTDVISSERFTWTNLNIRLGNTKMVHFTSDTTYHKSHFFNYEVFVSTNGIFNSYLFRQYFKKRFIWSAGIGYGRYTNYRLLDNITYTPGAVYGNNTIVVTKPDNAVSGKTGDIKMFNGEVIRAALYKPVTSPYAITPVHVGITYTSVALFTSNRIISGTAGLYITKRHWANRDTEELSVEGGYVELPAAGDTNTRLPLRGAKTIQPQKLVEDFSIGIITEAKNLQTASSGEWWKKNFKIMLALQIPLRFD